MDNFNVREQVEKIVNWIKNYFVENGNETTKCVVGISGGKDSSVVASLCVKALGKSRVIGVKMPCGTQTDIDYSNMLIDFLDIKSYEINIESTVNAITNEFNSQIGWNEQAKINTPARIRMATLYAVSAIVGGRVANTCNLSEDYVGYATKYGDGAGDFSPLSDLTVNEVKQIGYELGLTKELIDKTPTDGLCGKTDEDNLGFSYDVLDKYIRTGICENEEVKSKIDKMNKYNLHKLKLMPKYEYNDLSKINLFFLND